jgi:hypothetical protein
MGKVFQTEGTPNTKTVSLCTISVTNHRVISKRMERETTPDHLSFEGHAKDFGFHSKCV